MRDSRRLHHQQLQLAERLSTASTATVGPVGPGGYDMDLGATAATMAATQAHASTKDLPMRYAAVNSNENKWRWLTQ